MALNEKQSAFLEHYLAGETKGDATNSAIKAGYSPKTALNTGPRLTKHPEIAAAIAAAEKSVIERLSITPEWLMQSWMKNYERCTELVPALDRKGNPIMIKGPDGQMVPGYVMYDAKAGAKFSEMMGKFMKMFSEKTELPDPEKDAVKFDDLTPEEAARQYQELVRDA